MSMRGMISKTVMALAGLALLAACESDDPQLMNIKSDTPDEFSILPTNPLEAPEDYAALPAPTPGGTNLVDPNPQADAVAALGGNPDRLARGQIFAGEQTLLNHVRRFGVPGDIREVLAAEDLEWRKKNNGLLLERLFNVNVYFSSYKAMSLDQHLELERLRKAGVWTPSAPPDPEIKVD